MRLLLLSLLGVSMLFSDEIQRIESIVNDIGKLRNDYEKCRLELDSANKNQIVSVKSYPDDELNICKAKLKDEKEKSAILYSEIEAYSAKKSDKKALDKEIEELKKQISDRDKNLKIKENEIKSLENHYIAKLQSKDKIIKDLKNQINPMKTNVFPNLKMKEHYQKENKENIVKVKAASFRLKRDASIYDNIGGKEILRWERETSFTSNTRSENWIKITGYFVDKVWRSATSGMWIKRSDVIKR